MTGSGKTSEKNKLDKNLKADQSSEWHENGVAKNPEKPDCRVFLAHDRFPLLLGRALAPAKKSSQNLILR